MMLFVFLKTVIKYNFKTQEPNRPLSILEKDFWELYSFSIIHKIMEIGLIWFLFFKTVLENSLLIHKMVKKKN